MSETRGFLLLLATTMIDLGFILFIFPTMTKLIVVEKKRGFIPVLIVGFFLGSAIWLTGMAFFDYNGGTLQCMARAELIGSNLMLSAMLCITGIGTIVELMDIAREEKGESACCSPPIKVVNIVLSVCVSLTWMLFIVLIGDGTCTSYAGAGRDVVFALWPQLVFFPIMSELIRASKMFWIPFFVFLIYGIVILISGFALFIYFGMVSGCLDATEAIVSIVFLFLQALGHGTIAITEVRDKFLEDKSGGSTDYQLISTE